MLEISHGASGTSLISSRKTTIFISLLLLTWLATTQYSIPLTQASGGLNQAVEIGISLFVVGIVVPLGLQQISQANTTGINASVITILQVLLPVLAIIGIALYYYRRK